MEQRARNDAKDAKGLARMKWVRFAKTGYVGSAAQSRPNAGGCANCPASWGSRLGGGQQRLSLEGTLALQVLESGEGVVELALESRLIAAKR